MGTCGMLALIGLAISGPVHAQSATGTDAKITALEKQLAAMQQELHSLQKQAAAKPKPAAERASVPIKAAAAGPGIVVKMPNNRPTFCTSDNLNCLAITSRLHFDVANHDYRPNSAATLPQQAQNGVNARRARLGVLGTYDGAWDYGLIFDLGGSQDNIGVINTASLTYKGIKGLYIEGGYMDMPYTLDEQVGANNITFLERASPQVVAANIAGGIRSGFGARSNGDWWWLGSYVTGPNAPAGGFDHRLRSPLGMFARGVVTPVNNQYGSLMLGADIQYLFDTGQTAGSPVNSHNLTLSDRIEVRVDPGTNALLNTGVLANVDNVRVLSGEAAAQVGSFYAQGEYFDFNLQRTTGLPDLHFWGGYAQASYVLTGEQRRYNPVTASHGPIKPNNPVSWGSNSWGAWEVAARYSQVRLNDLNVFGGELRNTTVGVNWYVDSNIRFMFDWIHGNVAKSNATGTTNLGAHYDVFAMRTQIAF
jgi:phosphate-selective porin OprO and OprP